MPRTQDIAILGASPAGLSAAYSAAKRKLDVVVVDAGDNDAACPLAEWVGADTMGLKALPKGLARAAGAKAFRSVVYHGPTGQEAQHSSRSTLGYLVPSGGLTKALKASAVKAGVTVRTCKQWPQVRLAEDAVNITAAKASARMLLIAQNRPATVCADLSLSTGNLNESGMVARGLDIHAPSSKSSTGPGASLHVIQLPDAGGLGLCFAAEETIHVRVVGSLEQPVNGSALSGLVALLHDAGVLPTKLPLSKARGAVWYPPAGTAMEMETHVAKRCLLVGTSGGFTETISGHTLRPAIESALAGTDTVNKALKAKVPQTVLMSFKTVWRKALADYLRPPNTSLEMLMPLLFVNRRIVAKFTDAFLYGVNI